MLSTMFAARTADLFHQNPKLLGLGIWGIFDRSIGTHFGAVSSLPCTVTDLALKNPSQGFKNYFGIADELLEGKIRVTPFF